MSLGTIGRIGIGVVLIAHGVAHLVGFAVPWRLLVSPEMPYKTTLLAGRLDVGAAGIRIAGILWLLVGSAVAGLGVRAIVRPSIAVAPIAAVALVSLALCCLEWPQARTGLFVNLVVLAIVIVAR